MHVLLTNDDGIDAPGLAALHEAFRDEAKVTVAAPYQGFSGCGHQVTFRDSLRAEEVGTRRFKVYGTPADCVRIGVTALADDVDLVLSGINEGGNMGVDVYMSGTVAAVREAAWLGKPGLAFSQYFRADRARDWPKAAKMVKRVFDGLRENVSSSFQNVGFWNINLPDVDTAVQDMKIVETFPEPSHMQIAFEPTQEGVFELQNNYRDRPRAPGSDVDVCMGSGEISVSYISAEP